MTPAPARVATADPSGEWMACPYCGRDLGKKGGLALVGEHACPGHGGLTIRVMEELTGLLIPPPKPEQWLPSETAAFRIWASPPNYGTDGFCIACGTPLPSTSNTWSPLGLLCTLCRSDFLHGVVRVGYGGLAWCCVGCQRIGGPARRPWTFVRILRSFRHHLARCAQRPYVLRPGVKA